MARPEGNGPNDTAKCDEKILPAYWCSYASYLEGSKYPSHGEVCAISVVFDAGTQKYFSGVRLIIVVQETEKLNNVKIVDFFGNFARTINLNPKHHTHRMVLSYRRRILEHSEKLLNANNLHQNAPPLCTVVLELIDTSTQTRSSVGMVLRSGIVSETPLRIIYDRVISHTPIITWLELTSHHSFTGFITPSRFARCSSRPRVYSIRILPSSASRASFCTLPLSVLYCIALHAYSPGEHGFRGSILSFGLVCKAWLPLLDILYKTLGHARTNKPDPGAISRALADKPEKTRFIKRVDPLDYDKEESADPDAYEIFCRGYLAMLKLTTSVETLVIRPVHPSLFIDFLKILSALRKVKHCTIYGTRGDHPEYPLQVPRFDIYDIQNFTRHWSKLRELHVYSWGTRNTETICTNVGEFEPQYQNTMRIEVLTLYRGVITGAQLLQFVSPTQPHLQRVTLDTIEGLSNRDLIAFLIQVSPTLVYLSISECDILRDTEDEECAIDAVITKMTRLIEARIRGDGLVTLLAIRRKALVKSKSPKKYKRCILHIDGTSRFDMADIIEALQVTGWGELSIQGSNMIGWGARLEEESQNIAKARNIIYRVSNFYNDNDNDQ